MNVSTIVIAIDWPDKTLAARLENENWSPDLQTFMENYISDDMIWKMKSW